MSKHILTNAASGKPRSYLPRVSRRASRPLVFLRSDEVDVAEVVVVVVASALEVRGARVLGAGRALHPVGVAVAAHHEAARVVVVVPVVIARICNSRGRQRQHRRLTEPPESTPAGAAETEADSDNTCASATFFFLLQQHHFQGCIFGLVLRDRLGGLYQTFINLYQQSKNKQIERFAPGGAEEESKLIL